MTTQQLIPQYCPPLVILMCVQAGIRAAQAKGYLASNPIPASKPLMRAAWHDGFTREYLAATSPRNRRKI